MNSMPSTIRFDLKGDYIELQQLLKATGLCGTGGQARLAIGEGRVKADSKVETRKAGKIRRGQTVEFEGTIIQVA